MSTMTAKIVEPPGKNANSTENVNQLNEVFDDAKRVKTDLKSKTTVGDLHRKSSFTLIKKSILDRSDYPGPKQRIKWMKKFNWYFQAIKLVPYRRYRTALLQVWQNGYIVDNGPLNPFSSEFVADITRGRVPRDLAAAGITSVTFELHRNEDYNVVDTADTVSNSSQ